MSSGITRILYGLLQDHFITEEECNSVDFDAIYGRYTDLELAEELKKRIESDERLSK